MNATNEIRSLPTYLPENKMGDHPPLADAIAYGVVYFGIRDVDKPQVIARTRKEADEAARWMRQQHGMNGEGFAARVYAIWSDCDWRYVTTHT